MISVGLEASNGICPRLYIDDAGLDKKGDVRSRNVAVTFDLFEAEDHRNKGVENDYETFVVPGDWREDADSPN